MAYDNAVSALGKICQFHRDSIEAAQVHRFCYITFRVFKTLIRAEWTFLYQRFRFEVKILKFQEKIERLNILKSGFWAGCTGLVKLLAN